MKSLYRNFPKWFIESFTLKCSWIKKNRFWW